MKTRDWIVKIKTRIAELDELIKDGNRNGDSDFNYCNWCDYAPHTYDMYENDTFPSCHLCPASGGEKRGCLDACFANKKLAKSREKLIDELCAWSLRSTRDIKKYARMHKKNLIEVCNKWLESRNSDVRF